MTACLPAARLAMVAYHVSFKTQGTFSPVVILFCCLAVVWVDVVATTWQPRQVFTNSFLVRLDGKQAAAGHRQATASDIARRNGFENLGLVRQTLTLTKIHAKHLSHLVSCIYSRSPLHSLSLISTSWTMTMLSDVYSAHLRVTNNPAPFPSPLLPTPSPPTHWLLRHFPSFSVLAAPLALRISRNQRSSSAANVLHSIDQLLLTEL